MKGGSSHDSIEWQNAKRRWLPPCHDKLRHKTPPLSSNLLFLSTTTIQYLNSQNNLTKTSIQVFQTSKSKPSINCNKVLCMLMVAKLRNAFRQRAAHPEHPDDRPDRRRRGSATCKCLVAQNFLLASPLPHNPQEL